DWSSDVCSSDLRRIRIVGIVDQRKPAMDLPAYTHIRQWHAADSGCRLLHGYLEFTSYSQRKHRVSQVVPATHDRSHLHTVHNEHSSPFGIYTPAVRVQITFIQPCHHNPLCERS